jgi:predicted enzyme related to lactoylglutathione lyase
MNKRKIVHIEFSAVDRKKVSEFYAKAFDWGIQHADEMNYSMFEADGLGGGFNPVDGTNTKQGEVVVYLDSADIDADLANIGSLGGKTLVPKSPIPGMGWFALFADPGGNKVGLYTADPQAS